VGFLAQENLAVPPPVPGASVSRVVYELARRIALHGVDVTVCSLAHPTVAEGVHEGVRYLRVPPDLDRRRHLLAQQVLRVLRRLDLPHRELQGLPFYARRYAHAGLARLAEQNPDIVHLQNVSQFLPLARRLLPRARTVLHMHCDWLRQLPPREVRSRLQEADLVVAVSEYIATRVREGFPDLASRVRTLHNGVDTAVFTPRPEGRLAWRAEIGLGAGPVVLYVGTIAPEKGVDVLVRAFAQLRRRIPESSLVIVGAPNRYFQVRAPKGRAERAKLRRRQRSYAQEVARLAAAEEGRVLLAGPRPHDELPRWYALADVFAMPSTGEEPFPLPVLEAFASGLPVVATDRGGMPEIVADGVNGRLVPAGDATSLADALSEILARPQLGEQLGARGRELVCRSFSWEVQADRLLGLYRELVAGPPSRHPA
jgi:spore coat protein SA